MKQGQILVKSFTLETKDFQFDTVTLEDLQSDYATVIDDILCNEGVSWYFIGILFDDKFSEALVTQNCFAALSFIESFNDVANLDCISIFEFDNLEAALEVHKEILESNEIRN